MLRYHCSGAGGVGSSSTRVRRVTAAVVDRLTDRQGFKFPTSSALLAGKRCRACVLAVIWITALWLQSKFASSVPLAILCSYLSSWCGT